MKTPPLVSVGQRWQYPPTSEYVTIVEVAADGPWPIKYVWGTGSVGCDDLKTFLWDFYPADFNAWTAARDSEHAALWAERTRLARAVLAELAHESNNDSCCGMCWRSIVACDARAASGVSGYVCRGPRVRAALLALDGGTT